MTSADVEVAQNQHAIEVHSDQAGDFATRYEALERDPYASCFTYSRHRLRESLERTVPAVARGSQRALDVGCGTGHHLSLLAGRGYQVSGVDGSSQMLDEARRSYPQGELRLADVDHLPFADGSFDLVLCIEVLRYLPDPERCLAEIARVLRPGGRCIVTAAPLLSSNLYPLVNRIALLAPIGHLVRLRQYFTTPRQLRRQFGRAGFTDVAIQGVYTGPINWIERLAPRRLPAALRWWERWDSPLADQTALRGFSNMLLATAAAS